MAAGKAPAPLTIVDWRKGDAVLLAQCYQRERDHWLQVLGWETSWTWAMVERARITWGLPGLLAVEGDGRVRGWSFQLIEHGAVRIGGIVTDSAEVTAPLIDRILEDARGVRAELVSCFIAERAPNLPEVLAARGFSCEPFDYLRCELSASSPGGDVNSPHSMNDQPVVVSGDVVTLERWDHDMVAAADLFAAAYDANAALHFTTSGTLDEWRTYVRQLVEQPACGALDEDGTMMLRDRHGLVALALVTTLAPDTAHLAQIAVRPDAQGRGIATRLLTAALDRATAQRRRAMTLLVSKSNAPARHLYESKGFRRVAGFLAARTSLRSSVAIGAARPTSAAQQRS